MSLNNWEWNVLRKYLYWLLADANGTLLDAAGDPAHLPLGQKAPRTINEIYYFCQGLSFSFSLTDTLAVTSAALQDAAGSLVTAERLAGDVSVNAPMGTDFERIATDLEAVSTCVAKDRRAAALSSFFDQAASAIRSSGGS